MKPFGLYAFMDNQRSTVLSLVFKEQYHNIWTIECTNTLLTIASEL